MDAQIRLPDALTSEGERQNCHIPASQSEPLSSPDPVQDGRNAGEAKVIVTGDESVASLTSFDESLGVPHGSDRLEASFGRLSVSSSNTAAKESESEENSLSRSINANNEPANSDKQTELPPEESQGVAFATTAADPGDQLDTEPEPRLPSPSPSIRAYMLEYKNEPRPPPSAPRTPLSLSLSGLRRPPIEGLVVASTAGDYFSDNPLLSPKLEAIDEVTEDISAHAIETPAVGASQPSKLHTSKKHADSAQESTLLSILSSSSQPESSSSVLAQARKGKLDESMFDSPLAIPHRKSNNTSRDESTPLHSFSVDIDDQSSPSVGRMGQRNDRQRPSPLVFKPPQPLNLFEVNEKIQDILWNVGNHDESELLTPDEEEIGPASPFFAPPGGLLEQQEKAISAAVVQSTEIRVSTPSPMADLPKPPRKIPTLVGPNALPYARCPSGIDSFAFDEKDPRRYDAVLPPGRSSFASSPADFAVPITADINAPTMATRAYLEPTAVAGATTSDSSADMSSVSRSSARSHSSTLSANARARQRAEEKKQLVMRREQSRMEQQGRREMARIMRKLQRNPEDASKDPAYMQVGAADMSAETQIGDEQMQWHYDAEKGGWVKRDLPADGAVAPSGTSQSVLRSEAAPFVPSFYSQVSAPTHTYQPGKQHTVHTLTSQRIPGLSALQATELFGGGQASQNRLMQILHNRQPTGQILRQQRQQPFSAQSGGQIDPSILPFPNAAMVQAIQEISHFNQHLLALMSMQTAANRAALSQVAAFQPAAVVSGLAEPAPAFPILAPRPALSTLSHHYDPAIVHSYRRPDTLMDTGYPSHPLPARPAPAALSPRLTGIIPGNLAALSETKHADQLSFAGESQRSEATVSSEGSDGLLDKERKVRSNAPSPELIPGSSNLGGTQRPLMEADKPFENRKGAPGRQVLQQVSSTGSIQKVRPSACVDNEKQDHKGKGGKQDRKRDVKDARNMSGGKLRDSDKTSGNHAKTSHSRRARGKDSDWTAFVEQRMSGMVKKVEGK